jgi:hypothetical protein
MFSVGGAIRELQNQTALQGGGNPAITNWGAKVGWWDPKDFWTPERQKVFAERNAKADRRVYQRREVGGPGLTRFAGKGSGQKMTAGYGDTPGMASADTARPMRSSTAALARVASRGRAGWGREGYGR